MKQLSIISLLLALSACSTLEYQPSGTNMSPNNGYGKPHTSRPAGGTSMNQSGGTSMQPAGGTSMEQSGGTSMQPAGGTSMEQSGGTSMQPAGGTSMY